MKDLKDRLEKSNISPNELMIATGLAHSSIKSLDYVLGFLSSSKVYNESEIWTRVCRLCMNECDTVFVKAPSKPPKLKFYHTEAFFGFAADADAETNLLQVEFLCKATKQPDYTWINYDDVSHFIRSRVRYDQHCKDLEL